MHFSGGDTDRWFAIDRRLVCL